MKDVSFLKGNFIAHRGIYDNVRIYENTISAFERSIKYGYTIFIDVRILCDGTIVCFHDEDTKRLLHLEENIDKITYDELSYLSKFQIPKLEDVLKLINGSVPIIIEMRNNVKKYYFENKICELLDNYNGSFAIQSFNLKTIKWFYKNRKEYVTGYLICKKNSKKDYFFKKYDYLAVNILLYNDKKVKKLRQDKIVLGYKILNQEEFDKNITIYDNLIIDNILEINNG